MDPVWDGLPKDMIELPDNVFKAVRFWAHMIGALETHLANIKNTVKDGKSWEFDFCKYNTFFMNVLKEGRSRAQGQSEKDVWKIDKVLKYSIKHPLDVKKEKDRVEFFALQVMTLAKYKPTNDGFEERLKTTMQIWREMKYIIDHCDNQDNTFDIKEHPFAEHDETHRELLIQMEYHRTHHNSRHDDNHLFTMELRKTHEKLELLERIDPEAFQECRHYTFVENLHSITLESERNEVLLEGCGNQTRAELHRRIKRIKDQNCIWQKN
jgi:hypothetical protein